MKRNTFFYSLAVIVAVLLLSSGLIFYWLLSDSPLILWQSGKVVDPSAAIFVPKQAPAMVSLLVNPDRLAKLELVKTSPGNRRQARAELNEIKRTLQINTGLDYAEDISPWLGDEVTLALTNLDIDRNPSNGEQKGFLLALATKNPKRSSQFLDSFWQKQAIAGVNLNFEQYKGVKIIYSLQARKANRQNLGTVATALIGNKFVLFANDLKVLRDAINNVQDPGLNLKNSADYQQALQRLKERQIGFTFVNLAELNGGDSAPPNPPMLGGDSEKEGTANSVLSLAIAFGLNPQGLVAQTAFLTSDGGITTNLPVLSQPVEALKYLPAQSALAIGGSDLHELFVELSGLINNDNILGSLLGKPLSNVEKTWGIKLPEEIFNWVQGEYALGLLNNSDPKQQDWIFVAEKSPETDAAVARLDAIAKKQGFSIGALELQNQPVLIWTKLMSVPANSKADSSLVLKAEVQGVHATIGKYEIFATSVEAMNKALAAPQNSLLASGDFMASVAALPQPNQGYLYLNWLAVKKNLERQLPILQIVEKVGKPLFNNLRSLTFSIRYDRDDRVGNGNIFMRLGK